MHRSPEKVNGVFYGKKKVGEMSVFIGRVCATVSEKPSWLTHQCDVVLSHLERKHAQLRDKRLSHLSTNDTSHRCGMETVFMREACRRDRESAEKIDDDIQACEQKQARWRGIRHFIVTFVPPFC